MLCAKQLACGLGHEELGVAVGLGLGLALKRLSYEVAGACWADAVLALWAR